MKNFNETEITKLLKSYHLGKLSADERLKVDQLLFDNPYYREVLDGIALELKLEQTNSTNNKIKYMRFLVAASVIIGFFILGASWYNNNKMKVLMPQENGLPVFMNTQQQYDDVMNAIATKNYSMAIKQLNSLPPNDTTFYYIGYCYFNLGNDKEALISYSKVAEGYFGEKSKLWKAFIFLNEGDDVEAKSVLSTQFEFAELDTERIKMLNFISEKK